MKFDVLIVGDKLEFPSHGNLVMRESPHNRSFSVMFLKEGRVIALDCVNAIKDDVKGKALVLSGGVIDPALRADIEVPLKELAIRR